MVLQIEPIGEDSPYLKSVIALWRPHSDQLGFLPQGGFEAYARKQNILVALESGRLLGYILFRKTKSQVSIAQFCVDPTARKNGVARQLLDHLKAETRSCRGIYLNCRRDFEATKVWPQFKFQMVRYLPGRAKKGSTLIRWFLDYGHPNLFGTQPEPGTLRVVFDANVLVHMVEGTNQEAMALQDDWLQSAIELCYAPELRVDFNRIEDADLLKRRLAQLRDFEELACGPEAFDKYEALLKPLFADLKTEQSKSDFRHLIWAAASGVAAFVTFDSQMLSRSEAVHEACGLSVMQPSELIAHVDSLEHEQEYQQKYVAGTRLVLQERISKSNATLLSSVLHPGEKRRSLAGIVNSVLADPHRQSCQRLVDREGNNLAMFAIDRQDGIDKVPLLRVCARRQANSIVRTILVRMTRDAAKAGSKALFITEPEIPEVIRSACSDLGFLPVTGGYVKLVMTGWLPIDMVRATLDWPDAKIDELRAMLPEAKTDAMVASALEHMIWPAKLADAALRSFIVPIAPQFAEHLFDEGLASNGLFGAETELALNPESAYYRAAKNAGGITAPARILWYVKKSDKYRDTMAIRACSRLVEVMTDLPKPLFDRFKRLGVYEWHHVRDTADGDLNKPIMAFRFDDSESIPPIPWDSFQSVLRAHDIKTTLQSPREIPPSVFGQLYAAAFNPSAICGCDPVGIKAG